MKLQVFLSTQIWLEVGKVTSNIVDNISIDDLRFKFNLRESINYYI